ncbi:MAG TPA: signal peptidase II [Planctomycetota bacterium]|nr:signal peptidase II [Planctomycetota bacterium]
MRRPLPFFLLVAAGIALDLVSKWIVFQWLADDRTVALLPGVLHLTLARNYGVAFSMGKHLHSLWFVLLSLLFSVGLIWFYLRAWRTAAALSILAMGMILVGAVGNMIDRLFFGYVRDFIDFVPEIPLIGRWAIFNVADICITVGVVFYFIAELFLAPKPDAASQELRAKSQEPTA